MLSDGHNNTMSRSPKNQRSPARPSQTISATDPLSGLLTPPTSQAEQTPPQATMLMSPPPEETLRSQTPRDKSLLNPSVGGGSGVGIAFRVGFTGRVISNTLAGKRKRSRPSTSSSSSSLAEAGTVQDHLVRSSAAILDATPNPKARKQSKRGVSFALSRSSTPQPTTPSKSSLSRPLSSPSKKSLFDSPHARNPNADYIPPTAVLSREHTSSRRRSATPLPPYEPPTERFTPPREIICTPVAAMHTPKVRSHKSKAIAKGGKSKKLVLQIKKEFPEDIDLSAPLPPPSPTDDPLLLRGPLGSHRRRRPRASSHPLRTPVYARDTPPMASTSPIRGTEMDGTRLMDLNFDSVMDLSSEDATDDIPPLDFAPGNDGADDWSDEEHQSDHVSDETGNYTGKFKVVAVPTKADPPSSTTRNRIQAWGRPISPFPLVNSGLHTHEEVEEETVFTPVVSPAVSKRHLSSSPSVVGPSSVEDLFSPTRRTLRSPRLPPRRSPVPARRYSPLPPSDEEPPATEDQHNPSGPFDFDAAEDEHDFDDDLYEDQVVPIHDTSVDSIALEEDANGGPLSEPLEQETSFDDHVIPEAHPSLIEEHSSPHTESPLLPSLTPTASIDTSSAPLDPNLPDTSEDQGYRPSQVEVEVEGSGDEDEEEVSVVRELSQPRDFDEDDAAADHVADSFAKFNIFSSPNPFDLHAWSEDLHASQSSARRPRGSLVAERSKRYEESPVEPAVEDDDDDDLLEMDTKVIKITSEDPRAAARAAAILRLHKYDCLEHPSPRNRRHSAAGLDSAIRNARRKSTLDGGVTKASSALKRRQTLGGMLGDKVIIPGSPSMTLPQLLHEAEQYLHIEDRSISGSPFRFLSPLSYKTPAREPSLYESVLRSKMNLAPTTTAPGPRPWGKDDWKKLDSCYTDERLAVAEQAGAVTDEIASADEVDLKSVVDRFIELLGGETELAALGPSWTREDILKRVRALQRKQRSGHIAPPTPSRSGSVLSNDTAASAPYQRFMSSMSPETTIYSSTAAEDIYPGSPSSQSVQYAALIDEAVAISKTPVADARHLSSYTAIPRRIPPSSIANRVKGFLFSYLPYMNKGKPTPAPPRTVNPHVGLPIPPPDLFLRPRPPITTPASKPAPKPAHPRELVQLHPAFPPEKPSMIPRAVSKKPPWAIELNHVSPPPEDKSMRSSSSSVRGRRDSNASVKDLVKTFESLEKQVERPSSDLARQKSIEDWNAAATRNRSHKSVWKP